MIAHAHCTCCICGEPFEVEKRNCNSRTAANFVEWAEENIDTCRECEKKIRMEKRKAEEQRANLPGLVGTDKQVAWALDIRHEKAIEARDALKSIEDRISSEESSQIKNVIKQMLFTQTKAVWWIDNRFVRGDQLVASYSKQQRNEECAENREKQKNK